MAQRYNIHTKSQRELYKQYRNLLKRTRKFKGAYIEVQNTVANALEEARSLFRKTKLTQKETAHIKKLSSYIYSLRGESLKQTYVKKPVSEGVIDLPSKPILTKEQTAEMIIARYRSVLKAICTIPTGEVIMYAEVTHRNITGHGLSILEDKLDEAINTVGKLAVAEFITQFEPPYGDGWFYDSHEHYEFIVRMCEGTFDVPEDWSDEDIDEYYGE